MICPNCQQPTSRLIIDSHGKACANCRGLSESAGAKVSGILTRNSDRVRAQQQTHEGDMILPHRFDRLTGKTVPNEEFVARYPEQLTTYFTQEELQKQGYSKADKIFKHQEKKQAKHDADAAEVVYAEDEGAEKITEVVNNV